MNSISAAAVAMILCFMSSGGGFIALEMNICNLLSPCLAHICSPCVARQQKLMVAN